VGPESHGGGKRQAVNDDGELADFAKFQDGPKTASRTGLTHRVFEDEEAAVFIEGQAEDGAAKASKEWCSNSSCHKPSSQ
jgi:hypothetical protein